MDSPPNHEWEQALDIDYFDLQPTLVVRPSNSPHILSETRTTTKTMFSSQNQQVENCVVMPIRIIPDPVGIVQMTKLCKIADTREGSNRMSLRNSLGRLESNVTKVRGLRED
nr:hypothetical protein [Tanacetum cinerariifolium]